MKFRKVNCDSGMRINTATEGETIETKIKRILESGAQIEDTAPITYTDRKDGVLPEYNPKTDRWDIALEAMTDVAKSSVAKRVQLYAPQSPEDESTQGTTVTE